MTNTQAPLTILRESVRRLDQYERLALATYLTGTSNPKFQSHIIPEDEDFGYSLARAMEEARAFPSATKIFFAIELLELQIDRDEFEDEGDGLQDPSEFEEDTHYPGAYGIPDGDEYEEDTDDHYGVDAPGWDEVA